jgi:hypothetical protein
MTLNHLIRRFDFISDVTASHSYPRVKSKELSLQAAERSTFLAKDGLSFNFIFEELPVATFTDFRAN